MSRRNDAIHTAYHGSHPMDATDPPNSQFNRLTPPHREALNRTARHQQETRRQPGQEQSQQQSQEHPEQRQQERPQYQYEPYRPAHWPSIMDNAPTPPAPVSPLVFNSPDGHEINPYDTSRLSPVSPLTSSPFELDGDASMLAAAMNPIKPGGSPRSSSARSAEFDSRLKSAVAAHLNRKALRAQRAQQQGRIAPVPSHQSPRVQAGMASIGTDDLALPRPIPPATTDRWGVSSHGHARSSTRGSSVAQNPVHRSARREGGHNPPADVQRPKQSIISSSAPKSEQDSQLKSPPAPHQVPESVLFSGYEAFQGLTTEESPNGSSSAAPPAAPLSPSSYSLPDDRSRPLVGRMQTKLQAAGVVVKSVSTVFRRAHITSSIQLGRNSPNEAAIAAAASVAMRSVSHTALSQADSNRDGKLRNVFRRFSRDTGDFTKEPKYNSWLESGESRRARLQGVKDKRAQRDQKAIEELEKARQAPLSSPSRRQTHEMALTQDDAAAAAAASTSAASATSYARRRVPAQPEELPTTLRIGSETPIFPSCAEDDSQGKNNGKGKGKGKAKWPAEDTPAATDAFSIAAASVEPCAIEGSSDSTGHDPGHRLGRYQTALPINENRRNMIRDGLRRRPQGSSPNTLGEYSDGDLFPEPTSASSPMYPSPPLSPIPSGPPVLALDLPTIDVPRDAWFDMAECAGREAQNRRSRLQGRSSTPSDGSSGVDESITVVETTTARPVLLDASRPHVVDVVPVTTRQPSPAPVPAPARAPLTFDEILPRVTQLHRDDATHERDNDDEHSDDDEVYHREETLFASRLGFGRN